jgi:hypothetical protein
MAIKNYFKLITLQLDQSWMPLQRLAEWSLVEVQRVGATRVAL